MILVPFDATTPKTRLAPVLDADERAAFAAAMLGDVLDAVGAAEGGHEVRVLATEPTDAVPASVPVDIDDRPLTPAVNAVLGRVDGPVAVLTADLPLVTPATVERLLGAGGAGDVVLAAGRGGGTNAIVARGGAFRVDYHGVSYRDHREAAAEVGATVRTVDSFRLALDVDDPADLAEVLLHSEGKAAAWLREAGFAISTGDGRMRVERG